MKDVDVEKKGKDREEAVLKDRDFARRKGLSRLALVPSLL